MRLSLGLLAAALLPGVLGQQRHDKDFVPDYVLEANSGPLQINCQSRNSVTFNGTSPGPPLTLKEGHTTWVRVYNRIEDQNVTVHWHGLSQRTAPFSDGSPLVSQWPIAPGQFFDYEIRPEKGDAGSYYYHSHVGFQRSTAQGLLIVEDAGPKQYKYDADIPLMIGDFYKKDDMTIEDGLLGDPFTWSGEPDAVTINDNSGTAGWNSSDHTCAPHIIDVEPGKTYRLRAIGVTLLSLVKIGIEDHNKFEVIEADGAYTKSASIDHIQVTSGQRFSYLFKTMSAKELKKSGKTQFWVRYETRERPTSVTGYALLRYKTDKYPQPGDLPKTLPATSPVKLTNSTNDYLEYKLQPKDSKVRKSFPGLDQVTRTLSIQVNQKLTTGKYVDGTPNGTLIWVQNGHEWQENVQAERNTIPYLVQVYLGDKSPNYTLALENGGFDPVSRTFPAKVGEVLDIVWQNNDGPSGGFDFHPMHIHGEHAWDLGSGNGTYNATENEKHFDGFVPAKRDTTNLYRYTQKGVPNTTAGWRAWRIRITEDNVGAWMLHCHIAQHQTMGMALILSAGSSEDILKKFPATPYVQGYLDYGGSAYGDDKTDPFVYDHFAEKDAE